ncbi:hypothetical protein RCL_jg548.t1 [Rhizophagus clarus]|uniref:Uncharacterized protein n=1 Tax=Rhizophagus clarus TaxID=94130 RepID=A0A8H3LWG3_9GLOM|nr:hypothetical protein RCL_jg548.t1 [Rhizophagus clarus]
MCERKMAPSDSYEKGEIKLTYSDNTVMFTENILPFGVPVLPLVKLNVPMLSGPITTSTSSAFRTESNTSSPSTSPPLKNPSSEISNAGISHLILSSSSIYLRTDGCKVPVRLSKMIPRGKATFK